MESTTILSFGSIVCFAIFYEMVDVTYLEYITENGLLVSFCCFKSFFNHNVSLMFKIYFLIKISASWTENGGYENWMIVTGFIIGVVSAALCITILLFVGITKQVFGRIKERLAHNSFLKEVVPPLIGGICIGIFRSILLCCSLIFLFSSFGLISYFYYPHIN